MKPRSLTARHRAYPIQEIGLELSSQTKVGNSQALELQGSKKKQTGQDTTGKQRFKTK